MMHKESIIRDSVRFPKLKPSLKKSLVASRMSHTSSEPQSINHAMPLTELLAKPAPLCQLQIHCCFHSAQEVPESEQLENCMTMTNTERYKTKTQS